MKPRVVTTVVCALALVVGATLYFLFQESNPPGGGPTATAPTAAAPLTAVERGKIPPAPVPAEESNGTSPRLEYTSDKFYVDASGQLVLNEQARLHIEALIALTEPKKLYATTQEEAQKLPAAAAARASELVERYATYIQAQIQAFPPGIAPLNEEDMLAQMDGLHALRVAHFGEEVAEAFYGDEEKSNRELIEFMRLEKDQSLTMEEKADRAQALRDKLQRVAAIEHANREAGERAQKEARGK